MGSGRDDDKMTQWERLAQKEGLNYIEELVFENGAVYKGKFFFLIENNRILKGSNAPWARHTSMA